MRRTDDDDGAGGVASRAPAMLVGLRDAAPRRVGTLDWKDRQAEETLRKLWAEGLSAAAIARAMGASKNAIVGKAHRLGLPPPPAPARYGRVIPCCWPIGEPGRPGFRFCDDLSVPGKPYCQHHAATAYVKPTGRRDGLDAAA